MRTTLSLDDDVAAEIERLRRDRKSTYKDLVNEALRLGLRQLSAPVRRRGRFQTAAVDLGASRVGSLDDVAEALAIAEGGALPLILVDANLLIYAHVRSLPEHAAAREWLDDRLNGTSRVGLPWPSLLAFLRLVTNPRVFERPESIGAAWRQVEAWLACDVVWIPQPTERHAELLGPLLTATGSGANRVPDAHLAALALEHGLVLCSTDHDFARFPDLRWENPLAA